MPLLSSRWLRPSLWEYDHQQPDRRPLLEFFCKRNSSTEDVAESLLALINRPVEVYSRCIVAASTSPMEVRGHHLGRRRARGGRQARGCVGHRAVR